jgi:hypothetical protein
MPGPSLSLTSACSTAPPNAARASAISPGVSGLSFDFARSYLPGSNLGAIPAIAIADAAGSDLHQGASECFQVRWNDDTESRATRNLDSFPVQSNRERV